MVFGKRTSFLIVFTRLSNAGNGHMLWFDPICKWGVPRKISSWTPKNWVWFLFEKVGMDQNCQPFLAGKIPISFDDFDGHLPLFPGISQPVTFDDQRVDLFRGDEDPFPDTLMFTRVLGAGWPIARCHFWPGLMWKKPAVWWFLLGQKSRWVFKDMIPLMEMGAYKSPQPPCFMVNPPLCHYDPGNPLRRWSTEVQEGSHEEIRTLLLQMQVPRVGSHAMHFKTCWNGCRIRLVGIVKCLLPCREHGHKRGNCELCNEESSWTKENPYQLTEPAAIALAQVTTTGSNNLVSRAEVKVASPFAPFGSVRGNS